MVGKIRVKYESFANTYNSVCDDVGSDTCNYNKYLRLLERNWSCVKRKGCFKFLNRSDRGRKLTIFNTSFEHLDKIFSSRTDETRWFASTLRGSMETRDSLARQSVSRWKRAAYMVKSINVTNVEGTRSTSDRVEGNVEVASNTYGPLFVLRGFLSGCCQPINASFPYTGHSDAFRWWMSPGVYLSSASRTHNTGFISWRGNISREKRFSMCLVRLLFNLRLMLQITNEKIGLIYK